jgi:hypothetical protein
LRAIATQSGGVGYTAVAAQAGGGLPFHCCLSSLMLFVVRAGNGKAALVVLGELQEASFDERIRLIRKGADQSGLLTAKVFVHSLHAWK